MTRHVERIQRTTATDVLLIMGVVGIFTFLPPLVVVVINVVQHGFAPWVFITLGVGLFWPTVIGLACALENWTGDREQVTLIVDEAGVYLGGRRPRRIDWADVAEVALITQYVPPVRAGSSTTVRHYAAFRLRDAKPKKTPLRWRPRKACRDDAALKSIASAVRRLAPDVPVTVTTVGHLA